MNAKTSNSLRQFFELLFAFTQKEIKARYKNAVLGFLWMFLNPVIQMVVIGFVFSLIFRFGIKDYYFFLLAGLLPWNFFALSINKATPAIVYERNLIQKSFFPREVIPLSIVLSNFFHLLISLFLFLIFLGAIGKWQIFAPLNFLLFLISLFFLLIFTAGFSLITSSLNVFWRDITFFTQALVLIWFYATPILYPLSFIPKQFQAVFYLNPLSGIFTSLQRSAISNGSFPYQILLGQFLLIIFIFIFGVILFKNRAKYFSDWL
ncbi:ABC transporter permease [Patescibacteria group bacterium]|nr:ABC transporter permease [Patescibacteria group bacterium]